MNIDIKTADGEEIELGGAYYDGRGTEYRAVGVRLIDYRRIANVSLSCRKYQGLRTFYVSCLGCGARTDLEYAEEFAADLWNERVSYVE